MMIKYRIGVYLGSTASTIILGCILYMHIYILCSVCNFWFITGGLSLMAY